jgi:signal transduction histidine kinase
MKIRVTSIFVKIVAWFVATVALSLLGYFATSVFLSARLSSNVGGMPRMSALFLDDARRAFEEGGPLRLDAYLRRLNSYTDTEHHLLDKNGLDLVTGQDRSDLLAARQIRLRRERSRPRSRAWPFGTRSTPAIRVRTSDDNRYRLVAIVAPTTVLSPWVLLAYFLWLPLLIAVLCYLLAVHLASPLRALRSVVDRFGRGDLGIRSQLIRHDEIGDLAHSFNRMAEQITTLRSAERRLLQDVSHELRSPLARLGFAVELARTSSDREAALTRIRNEADRLSHLVDELLELTRAEGDPTAQVLEPVDLEHLLRDLVADCSLEAEAQGRRLVTHLGQDTIVTGDRELLRRACENVLRNAIRHAPRGTSVEVNSQERDDRATITIRDHGPGVPADSLQEIFKPFYRVESDRDRSSGGTGLGLAIAHRAVLLHHGRMTAKNASPGLIVEIELPIAKSSTVE